jgi:polyhydroxybutyrate depolymerase
VQRTALVNVPPQARPDQPLPLILAFHGAGGNGAGTEASTGLSRAADHAGFIVAYPNAYGTYWRSLPNDTPGRDADLTFVRSLLDQLDATLCVDDRRVYATGGSNGAGFAALLACTLNDRLAAIAPVAGIYRPDPTCPPRRPLSVLEIHGTNDTTAPYDGSPVAGRYGVLSFLDEWFTWDACAAAPPVWRRLGRWALWVAKSDCSQGTTVAHIKLLGEPHAWPHAARAYSARAVAFDASQAIVQFFDQGTVTIGQSGSRGRHHRRSPPPAGSSPGGAVAR